MKGDIREDLEDEALLIGSGLDGVVLVGQELDGK